MKITKNGSLMSDNTSNPIILDAIELHREAGYTEDEIAPFTANTLRLLNDYTDYFGAGKDVEYTLKKSFYKIDLRLVIPGDHFDPFERGSNVEERIINNIATVNLNSGKARIHYKYTNNRNYITVRKPREDAHSSFLKNPTVISTLLGIISGIICLYLPEQASAFLIDQLAVPVESILLNLMAGIMGPVIFISIITSIVAFGTVSDLKSIGFRIINRFIRIILFVMAVSIVISGTFFRNFGSGSAGFAPGHLIDLILDIIPTNIVDPFHYNNTAQLVVLGFLLGAALLLIGDGVKGLSDLLLQINEWMMSALSMILTLMPLLPFLSILTVIGKGNWSVLLEGWKFIAASYIVYTVIIVIKAVKTSVVTGISIASFWQIIKPAVTIAFTTASLSAPLKKEYEVSENELNIRHDYTSFWIPVSAAMLSPGTTVNIVVGTFMLAEIAGVSISASFLAVLIILTFELSIASPGTEAAWTIVFETLALPASYVGIFSAYRLFTRNYHMGVVEAYCLLEETESAYKLGGIRQEKK